MNRTQLKTVPQSTSARAELGTAITRRDELKRKLAATNEAGGVARKENYELEDDRKAAQQRVAEAEQRAVDARVLEVQNKPVPQGKSVLMARVDLAAIEEKIQTTELARKILDAQYAKIESELKRANIEVEEAVRRVVSDDPAVVRVIEDFKVAVQTVRELGHVLDVVSAPSNIRSLSFANFTPSEFELATKWKASIAELHPNAAVELP